MPSKKVAKKSGLSNIKVYPAGKNKNSSTKSQKMKKSKNRRGY